MEALVTVAWVILIYSAMAVVFFGLCFFLAWIFGPPEEDVDVDCGSS